MAKTLPTYVTVAGQVTTTWTQVREQCADRQDERETLDSIELSPRVSGRLIAQNSTICDAAYREVWAVTEFPAPSVATTRARIELARERIQAEHRCLVTGLPI